MNDITTKEEFDAIIAHGTVVLELSAEWCMPCHMMTPILDTLSTKYANIKFCKVDVEEGKEITEALKISAVPTILIFKDGKQLQKIIGSQDRKTLDGIFSLL